MQGNTTYRVTVNGDSFRQYHLHSRRVAAIYAQTYLKLGKHINVEQLVDGFWKPVSLSA